jgi:Leucine-rich repeat (LRR) protein
LKRLWIEEQNIKFLSAENFENLDKVVELFLDGNPLSYIQENVFEKLINLQTLHLDHCLIKSLSPKAFAGLNSLKLIDLSDNFLTHLKSNLFDDSLELEWILLNNNRLKKIEIDFAKFLNITRINLSKNVCIDSNYYPKGSSIRVFQEIVKENCNKLN